MMPSIRQVSDLVSLGLVAMNLDISVALLDFTETGPVMKLEDFFQNLLLAFHSRRDGGRPKKLHVRSQNLEDGFPHVGFLSKGDFFVFDVFDQLIDLSANNLPVLVSIVEVARTEKNDG